MSDNNNNTPDSNVQTSNKDAQGRSFGDVDQGPLNVHGGSVLPEEFFASVERNGFTFSGEFPKAMKYSGKHGWTGRSKVGGHGRRGGEKRSLKNIVR